MRVLYTIRGVDKETYQEFRNRILRYTREHLMPLCKGSVVVSLTDQTAPRFTPIPFRKDQIALVSLDDISGISLLPQPPAGFCGYYISEVAYPMFHKRTWELGQKTPGACLLTFFHRKKGLDDKSFFHRWYNNHTPLTFKIHPNAGYVRNSITGGKSIWPDDRLWAGIVEEQYDPESNLANPVRFFGGTVLKMIPAMIREYFDVKSFIDLSSVHTWYASEYRLK